MDINIRELLEEEFRDDPVRKEISIHQLDEFLFTDRILSMHPETSYSTTEASAIIERADSTIRNYFRTDLVDYIGPERHGRFYRLDYKSVFKIHMILLLIEKLNKQTTDISFILGLTGRITHKSPNTISSDLPSSNVGREEIDQIRKLMVQQQIQFQLFNEESNLNKLQVEKLKLEKEIQDIDVDSLKDEQKKSNEKYYRVLDYSLKNTVGKTENKGILSSLFRSKSETPDVDGVLSEARNNSEIDNKYKEVEQEREAKRILLNEELQEITEKIQEKEQNILKIREKVNEMPQIENIVSLMDSQDPK